MQQAGVKPGSLDEVILVGGSTYMPVVEQMLREVTGQEPSRELLPERAVAEGAAIHAAILQARSGDTEHIPEAVLNRLKNVRTSDVNSHSLGIKISDPADRSRKINHIMIPRNTPVRTKSINGSVPMRMDNRESMLRFWKVTRRIRQPVS